MNRTRFMRGLVAEVFDEARLGDQGRANKFLKRRLMNACRESRLERVLQRAFVAIEPVDDSLERQPRVDASRSRIICSKSFRLHRKPVHLDKLGFEEGKLRHLSPIPQRLRFAPNSSSECLP